jgi:F420-non-reducing hydrogenase iron-sulfur subunit
MSENGYEPKIIAYLCNWCSYAGADGAGMARMKYPTNVKIIRVPCSGRVPPELILRTFQEGADGVMILGCHIGDCHYGSGNHRTAKRMPLYRKFLEFAGIEPERFYTQWVSASEGGLFTQVVTEFTETLREMPPMKERLQGTIRTD